MDILTTLQALRPDVSEPVLNYYIQQATNFFLTQTNLTAVPSTANTLIIDIVLQDVNTMGYEGLENTNMSGVSYAFSNQYSEKIWAQIAQFRKLVW